MFDFKLSQSTSDFFAEVITLIALWIGAFSLLCAVYITYTDPQMDLESAERILALEEERDMLAARVKSLMHEKFKSARLSFLVRKGRRDLARVTQDASTYISAHQSLSEQFEDCAIMIRDKDRVIQTQAHEIERLEHRVAHAQECLEAKDNLIKRKDLDARAHQRSAFQYPNSIYELSEKIAIKDDQLWEAAGRYTVVHQELTKLQLYVSEGTVEAIERRDNTIKQLEQKVQDLNEVVEHDPPGLEKAVNRLLRSRLMDARADLLVYQRQLYERHDCMRLQGKKIDEINSRNLAIQKELKESVSTCASLQKALDATECKNTELQTELQDCTQRLTQAIQKKRSHDETCDDRTAKIIALKKAADTHEKANQHLTAKLTKVTTKLQAEKQHILNALTSAQHSLNAANATIHSQDATITRNRTELTKANDHLQKAGTSVGQQTDGDVRASEQLKTTQDELAKVNAELEVKRGFIDHIAAHAKREMDAKQDVLVDLQARLTAADERLMYEKTAHEQYLSSQLQKVRNDCNKLLKQACNEAQVSQDKLSQELQEARQLEKEAKRKLPEFIKLAKTQTEKLEEANVELKGVRERSQTTLHEKEALLSETKAKLTQAAERADKLEKDIGTYQYSLHLSQGLLSDSRVQVEKLTERIKQAEALANERRGEHLRLVDRVIELQDQRKKLQKVSSEREQQLATANAALTAQEESHKNNFVQQLSQRDERIAQLETRSSAYDESVTFYKQRTEQLVAFSTKQNQDLAAAHTSLQTASTHCKNAQAQVLRQRGKLDELAAEIQKVKAGREELMSHMASVSEALLESDAKNENLEGLARRLGAKVEELRDDAANLREGVEEYREEERREGFVNVGEEEEDVPHDFEYDDEYEYDDGEEVEEEESESESDKIEILSCPDDEVEEEEQEQEEEEFVPVEEADCSYDDEDDHQILEEEVEEAAQSLRMDEVDEDSLSELDWYETPSPEAGNGQPEPEPDNSTAWWASK